MQFISIKVKVPKFTQRHWCLCSPILFCSVSNKLAFTLVILFLRPAVSRPHTENPFQRTPDLQSQQECLERLGTVCHKCSLNCSRSPSYQKHNKLRDGRHMSGAKRRKFFLSCPPLFWLYKYKYYSYIFVGFRC